MRANGILGQKGNLLLELAEDMLKLSTADQFASMLRGPFQKLFPHGMFLGAIGQVGKGGLIPLHVLSWNFPWDCLRHVISAEGHMICPMITAWVAERRPQLINVSEPSVPPDFRECLSRHGVRNTAGHGQRDIHSMTGSYFCFANIPAHLDERHSLTLELVVPYLHSAFARVISASIHQPVWSNAETSSLLTRRELEILQAIYEGKTNKEISKALQISQMTVKNHAKNLYEKLGVRNRCEAIAKGIEHRLVLSEKYSEAKGSVGDLCRNPPDKNTSEARPIPPFTRTNGNTFLYARGKSILKRQ